MGVGICASGLAATSALAAGFATPTEMLGYLALGSLGSLLPDLDADQSTPVQISFTVLSVSLAFAVMFHFAGSFDSVAELLLVWVATYLFFRWLVFALFTRLTTHRGIFHSLPAALATGGLTAILTHHFLQQTPVQAWTAGSFVTFGFLVHLVLDEAYSVNLFGMYTKRSFGTAFKLWSPGSHAASIYMYVLCGVILWAAPEHRGFLQALSAPSTYAQIRERLLPEKGWFSVSSLPRSETIRSAPPSGHL